MTDAVARRAQGKSAIRARTHWTVEIGQRLTVRCIEALAGGPVFQIRAQGKWRTVTTGASALALFKKFAASETLDRAFEK